MKYRPIMYKNRFWSLVSVVLFLNMGDSGQSLLGKKSLSYILPCQEDTVTIFF